MFENKDELIELLESQKDLLSPEGTTRIHDESLKSRSRAEYKRDYSRVLYANSFRRLQGKMQLMPVKANKFNRNRLTHSLEVSQIARSIAEKLQNKIDALKLDYNVYNENSIYVVEAGALAHDIGNAPFGHHGEKVLNELGIDFGGYEGNAQSLRILMNVEKKFPQFDGINLSLRTLLSIVKYNVPFNGSKKKFLYNSEYNDLINFLRDNDVGTVMRTIDAQIVDAADEITYCAHDLEEALAQNYFTIDEFLFDLKQHSQKNEDKDDYPYEDLYPEFEKWVNQAKEFAHKDSNNISSEEYSSIFRKELTSIIVDNLIKSLDVLPINKLKDDFEITTGTLRKNEIAFKNWKLVRGIKYCTFEGINRTSDIQVYEKIGTKVIKGLYNALSNDAFNEGMLLLTVEYRTKSENISDRYRMIADYIGGLMDPSAIEIYSQLHGDNDVKKIYDELFFTDNKV